jgi:hypothetical protein
MPNQTAWAMRHHRHRILQPVRAQPGRAQEPEERAQRRRGQLRRSRLVAARQVTDEADDVPDVDRADVHRAVSEHRLQEHLCVAPVIAPRPRTQATGTPQVLIESREQVLACPPICCRHQLLLVFRTDRTDKERCDYVQLRRPASRANPRRGSTDTSLTPPDCT